MLTLPPIDSTTKDWLELAISAVAAAATVWAVWVALRLARQDKKPAVKVSAYVLERTDDNGTKILHEVFISGVNIGYTPVTMLNMAWELGFPGKRSRLSTGGGLPTLPYTFRLYSRICG